MVRRLRRRCVVPSPIVDVGLVFLRLGLTSFGGPAAHVALMRDEFVRRRGWLDDAAFLDLVGAANLIPGPTSSELAMHIGHRRAGAAGLLVAGIAFLLPAVVIVGVLAWWYVGSGQRPAVEAVLAGVAPIVVAIIAHAGVAIARTAIRSLRSVALVVLAAAAALVGVPEIAVLLGSGVVAVAIAAVADRGQPRAPDEAGRRDGGTGDGVTPDAGRAGDGGTGDGVTPDAGRAGDGGTGDGATPDAGRAGDRAGDRAILPGLPTPAAIAAVTSAAVTVAPLAIFGEFLKIGAVLFGSGYVLVALLRDELVEGLGWITETQLIDAVAIGQATPGPLFSTATFIGYLVAGPIGAVAATVGIFLPAFVAVAISIPILARLRGSRAARAALDGVNAAAVALLVIVAVQLAVSTLRDPLSVAVALAAGIALLRGAGTLWLIAVGAVIGLIRMTIAPG